MNKNKEKIEAEIKKIQEEVEERCLAFISKIMPISKEYLDSNSDLMFAFCAGLEALLEGEDKDIENALATSSEDTLENISLESISSYKKNSSILMDALGKKRMIILFRIHANKKRREENERENN